MKTAPTGCTNALPSSASRRRRALFDPKRVNIAWLDTHDAYYLRRGEALRYADAARTLADLSPHTGDLVLSVDRLQRLGRWLFNFLHSWDLPRMLRPALARDAALIGLSMGALALALTGVVLGIGGCGSSVLKGRARNVT